ncbi:hypothetical protein CYMTET_8964 [Cymbomonas tetramitiformis]|uniref:Phospholipid-transporting ATPase n=1 Tax=Cymbomonas tetramitiformis TaxID=36881 RepID=A0AAE0KZG8_9CHLO|nr:hypothetical protein CYMTET_25029 [Cymbomonas tetramitiformis]KAK3283337.1 hypothetical protein CYMTET_8964 [Cymbomonas tetramitiformis]
MSAAENRLVYCGDPEKSECARVASAPRFSPNISRTTRYTLLTFLPHNLFEQFRRPAYLYFLLILLLNQLPWLAVFGRTASLFPLLTVILVTGAKDAYEDLRRFAADRKENQRDVEVLRRSKDGVDRADRCCFRDLRVGDLVRVTSTAPEFPADLILVSSSRHEGDCFVETSNLDGESNLKPRDPVGALHAAILAASENSQAQTADSSHNPSARAPGAIPAMVAAVRRYQLVCEEPTPQLYSFNGRCQPSSSDLEAPGSLRPHPKDDAEMEQGLVENGAAGSAPLVYPLGPANLLLRGCRLMNTSWVLGVVVGTGNETKAALNSRPAGSKRSQLERQLDRCMLLLGIALGAMCLFGAVGCALWMEEHAGAGSSLTRLPYLGEGVDDNTNAQGAYQGPAMEAMLMFFSCIIMFQVMIPIALYVSVELVRLLQAHLMACDQHMCSAEGVHMRCRALNINEDLGQVRWVFTDKTGTLTENRMSLRRLLLASGRLHSVACDAARPSPSEPTTTLEAAAQNKDGARVGLSKSQGGSGSRELLQAGLPQIDDGEPPALPHAANADRGLHSLMLGVSLCNTVLPEQALGQCAGGEERSTDGKGRYQGESSDEVALVEAAAEHGWRLVARGAKHVGLEVHGQVQEFVLVGLNEFDHMRMGMSVVVRGADGRCRLLWKGADSALVRNLAEDSAADWSRVECQLDELAKLGLRVMCYGERELSEEQVARYVADQQQASMCPQDRSWKLSQCAEQIECGLRFTGATGIQDALQRGAAETVAQLREAGMRVMMLTGDKLETAIAVAQGSGLITAQMDCCVINGESGAKGTSDALMNAVMSSEVHEDKDAVPHALALTGVALGYIMEDETLHDPFLQALLTAHAIVACRASPAQKAWVVELVRGGCPHEVTLAIGDGANDVPMLRAAHIGVGLCGQEGLQAALASDFSFAKFRFLSRLLFLHGHWNYYRLGTMVAYNIYKNAVFVLLLMFFLPFNGYSAIAAIDEWNLVLYSMLYTSLPTIAAGLLDQDVSEDSLLTHPELYTPGMYLRAFLHTRRALYARDPRPAVDCHAFSGGYGSPCA